VQAVQSARGALADRLEGSQFLELACQRIATPAQQSGSILSAPIGAPQRSLDQDAFKVRDDLMQEILVAMDQPFLYPAAQEFFPASLSRLGRQGCISS